jgi:hypothetical protein
MTVKLPTEKTHPKTDLVDLSLLIYGPPKIGKSTLCSHADGALFLATEPGLNSLDVFQIPISSWEEMTEALAMIAAGRHDFRTIVIDTVDNAYRFCEEFVCKRLKIDHPSDADYGKGFSAVNSEFIRVLTKLGALPYGLILTSHAKEKEVTTRTGKTTKIGPTLPDSACKIVKGFADCILFCDVEEEVGAEGRRTYRRVIRTRPTTHYEAGDRTGRLPETLPLDYHSVVEAIRGTNGKGARTEGATDETAMPAAQPASARKREPKPGATAPAAA